MSDAPYEDDEANGCSCECAVHGHEACGCLCPAHPASELKPCPFCGHVDSGEEVSQGDWVISCEMCGCIGPMEKTQAEAIAAWNERAEPERPVVEEHSGSIPGNPIPRCRRCGFPSRSLSKNRQRCFNCEREEGMKTLTLTPKEVERGMPEECHGGFSGSHWLGRILGRCFGDRCLNCNGNGFTPGVVLVPMEDEWRPYSGLPQDYDGSDAPPSAPYTVGEDLMLDWTDDAKPKPFRHSQRVTVLTVEPSHEQLPHLDGVYDVMRGQTGSAYYWRIETAPRGSDGW